MFQFCQFQNNRKLFTDRQTDKQKDRQTKQIIEAPPWSLIRIWNVCCYSHYYTFPYIYKFGQIKVFQKISTDRPTDRGTDRQTNLLIEAPSRSLKIDAFIIFCIEKCSKLALNAKNLFHFAWENQYFGNHTILMKMKRWKNCFFGQTFLGASVMA